MAARIGAMMAPYIILIGIFIIIISKIINNCLDPKWFGYICYSFVGILAGIISFSLPETSKSSMKNSLKE